MTESMQESYPSNWKRCVIFLNPETGEMHSDGDHSVRLWIQERIKPQNLVLKNGKWEKAKPVPGPFIRRLRTAWKVLIGELVP